MLKTLAVKNFKSFSDSEEIKFAPITLIYGPNSSGKSSLIQSLMLLKQTLLTQEPAYPLITNGESISIGDFSNIIHKHVEDNLMEFLISFDQNYDAEDYFGKHGVNLPFANSIDRKASFKFKKGTKKSGVLEAFELSIPDRQINVEVKQRGTYDSSRYTLSDFGGGFKNLIKSKSPGLALVDEDITCHLNSSQTINLPFRFKGKRATSINEHADPLALELKDLLSKLKYLGPLRSSPKRLYSTELSYGLKNKGKHNLGVDLLNSSEGTKVKINALLEKFNIPYHIEVSEIGDNVSGDVVSVHLTDLRTNARVTPADVGFGIGQVLPIVLEAVSSKDSILCVEQPEIHLHPKLQADLADLFIESVGELGEIKNQWVIETHSEALMLRLQRRIRDGSIPKELISVIFVDVGEYGASALSLELNDEGDFIDVWPGGFFEERLHELYGA
jgi:AAA ATPase domain